MSTEIKPNTSAVATTVATTVTTDASPEKATDQLKQQLSSLFGFFSKVSDDVTASTTKLTTSLEQKGPMALLEALKKKAMEKSKPLNDNSVSKTDKEKSTKQKGDKSNKENAPQQTLKEENSQVQPPAGNKDKPKSAKPVENTPAVKFNSFKDLFGSISSFISQTATSIQTGSANMYNKLQSGIDINAKIKSGFRPTLIKQEPRQSAVDIATKKRLEEAKKMKENFEKQLKALDQEITTLEKGEDSHMEEGSNRQPKAFRINSQKSGRENSDKSSEGLGPVKPAKKVLGPLEDVKHVSKKWQGERVMKNAASQPLYMRMEKEFMQNVIFPELEARKEKLKLKREFYKPIDDKELREHALKYEERKKNLVPIEKEGNDKPAPLHFVKSNAYKKVLEQEKEDKVKVDQRAEERKQLKEKQQQYAKIVKEMFFPKPDPKDDLLSKENLQEIIARSQKAELPMVATTKEPNNTTSTGTKIHIRKKRTSHDISQQITQQTQQSPERTFVPHTYLKRKAGPKVNLAPPVVEDAVRDRKEEDILPKEGVLDEETDVKPQKKKYEYQPKPRMVSMSPRRTEKKLVEKAEDEVKQEILEPELAKKSYPNYLVEIRKKRIDQEKKTGKGKFGQWEKVLKNKALSQQEKVLNILDDITRMETQVKRKEDRLKKRDPTKEYEPLELEDEVGEMYLESIKAKLAIIKDLA